MKQYRRVFAALDGGTQQEAAERAIQMPAQPELMFGHVVDSVPRFL